KYDVRDGFQAGWQEFLRRERARKVTRPTKCVACVLKAVCGMCPANGELENGDPEAPVDWLCRTAHLRAMALGIPIVPHGDCEYCGGAAHGALAASAERLRTSPVAYPPAAITPDARRHLPLLALPPPPRSPSRRTH